MRWPLRCCPDCGAPLQTPAAPSATLSRQDCGHCGAVHFRNPKPCAGVLPVRDGRVLLARRAGPPRAGTWDIVGGFLEPGEHPEAGALREAREETGLEMEILGLVGLFIDTYGEADGPADGVADITLNIYYEARPLAGNLVAADDVAELRWFDLGALPTDLAFPHEADVLATLQRRRTGPNQPDD